MYHCILFVGVKMPMLSKCFGRKKYIPARGPKQCEGAKGYETSGGDDDGDDDGHNNGNNDGNNDESTHRRAHI